MVFFSNEKIENVLVILGLLCAGNRIFRILYRLFRFFQFRRLDLAKRYGEGSYVIVTGSSDGIGRGLAFAFAERRFNLILISRTKAKLEKVESEIKAKHPGIKILLFSADFTNAHRVGFFDEVYEKTKHLDISILVNNAALDCCARFLDAEEKEYIDLVVCNTIPVVTLTRKYLPDMLRRRKKCAVINMSSVSGVLPTPFFSVYSGTKAHVDFLTNALRHEYREIDFMNVRPGYVSTPMTFNQKPSFDTLTIEQCVNGIMRDVGHMQNTYGHWKHQAQNYLIEYLPNWIVNWVYMNFEAKATLAHCTKGREISRKGETRPKTE